MIRGIKFRAWDTLYIEMIYDVQHKREDRTFDQFLDSRYALMQFTGLHDKNGKEIWEGDIVEWKGYEVQNGKQIRPTRRRVIGQTKDPFRISFIDDCFHLQNLAEKDNTLEVIGNVYENKELLNRPEIDPKHYSALSFAIQ